MGNSNSRLGILVESKYAGGGIKSATSDLGQLDRAAKGLTGGLAGIAGLAGGAGLVLLGQQAAGAAFEFAKMAAQAGDMRVVFDGLAADVGESGDAMLSAMQKTSAGMVSNAALVQGANRAMLLGVADSSTEMSQLLEVARVRGQAFGLTLEEAFDRVVTGIGRQSALILDDLGIQVDATAVNKAYADSLGKSANSLSEAEKKQALYNHVLATTAPLIANSVTAGNDQMATFEQLATSAENAKIALGEMALAAGLPEFLDVVNQSLKDSIQQLQTFAAVTGAIQAGDFQGLGDIFAGKEGAQEGLFEIGAQLTAKAQELRQSISDFQDAAISGNGSSVAEAGQQMKVLELQVIALAERYNELAVISKNPLIDINQLRLGEIAFQGTAEAIKEVGAAAQSANPAIISTSDLLRDGGAASLELRQSLAQSPAVFAIFADAARAAGVSVGSLIGLMDQATAQLNQLAGARAGVVSGLASQIADLSERGLVDPDQGMQLFQEGVGKVDRQVQVLTEQLARGNITQDEFAFQMAFVGQTADDTTTSIDEADAAAKRYASTLAGDAKSAANEAARAFEDLKSKVSGVLSDALSDTAGVNPDEILGNLGIREDAIAENARRLADVAANGFKDQDWLGEFAAEVPDIFKELQEAGDPRAAAAAMLKEFQQGFRPELLDKDLLKQTVKDMIMGDQAKEQLATELAQELAGELGTSIPDALAAAREAVGARGGAAEDGGGSEIGAQFAEGISSAGTTALAKLNEILRNEENLKQVEASGEKAGEKWGLGFLRMVNENVPQQLIDLLANLVTPLVQGNLKQQQSLTGASG